MKLPGVKSYRQIAQLLADLRDALAQDGRSGMAEARAIKLRRRAGFLSK